MTSTSLPNTKYNYKSFLNFELDSDSDTDTDTDTELLTSKIEISSKNKQKKEEKQKKEDNDELNIEDLDKYGFPSDLSLVFKTVLSTFGHRYNVFNLEKKISLKLFNYLYENDFISLFTGQSLSLFVPVKVLYKISNKIEWDYVLKRDDLSDAFIKENIKKFDIQKLDYKYYMDFDLMLENIKSNHYVSLFEMIKKLLLSKKYTYDQFMILLKHINKNSYDSSSSERRFLKDDFKMILVSYMSNYYKQSSTNNTIRLKDFVNMITGFNNKYNFHLTSIIVELLKDKITPWDLEFLIQNDVMAYYTGETKISNELINVFYSYRHKLFEKNSNKKGFINPFINQNYKYYTYEQIEELIKLSIISGIASINVWNYVSNNILDLNTPKWFWKKHTSSIHWYIVTERIISLYDENDILQNELFLQWMLDYSSLIHNGFIINLPNGFILPEIFIAFFTDIEHKLLSQIMKFQRLSISLLNYFAENNVFTKDDWNTISSFQVMNPQFIKKYESKLDWSLLKFNISFVEYPAKSFHKLPISDDTNKFLWMTIDDKVTELRNLGVSCEANKTDMTIIISCKDNIKNNFNHFIPSPGYTIIPSNVNKNNKVINKLLYDNTLENWHIRNGNFNLTIIEEKDYNKVVYNFNQLLMTGGSIGMQQLKTALNYIPMSVGAINVNKAYNSYGSLSQFKMPSQYLMFSNAVQISNNPTIMIYNKLQ
jgi:hypothetical protein